jgi:hypothetical protein
VRVQAATLSSDLANLPVMVKLDDTRVDVAAVADGAVDLRFISYANDPSGVPLAHEVEQWVSGVGGVIWVRLPNVPAASFDDGFWVYYGNPNADDGQNSSAVWDDGYVFVMHGNRDELGSFGTLVDSSNAANDANWVGPQSGLATVDGSMGPALELGGAGGMYIDVPALDGVNFPQTAGTVRLWASADIDSVSTSDRLLDTWNETRNHYFMRPTNSGSMQWAAQEVDAMGGYHASHTTSTGLWPTWWTVALSWGPSEIRMYTEGSRRDEDPTDGFLPDGQLARFGHGFPGAIDEIRVSSVQRSDAWISLSTRSERDRLLEFGDPVVPPAGDGDLDARVGGALVLYAFDDLSGATVPDLADEGVATPLVIEDLSAVTLIDGGLTIDRPTMLTAGVPTDVIEACSAANAMTVEAWLMPSTTLLDGPARIVTVSSTSSERNVTLGQENRLEGERAHRFNMRLRTSESDENGSSIVVSGEDEPKSNYGDHALTAPEHIVAVHEAGSLSFYLNGALVDTDPWPGDYSNWDATMTLGIGDEFNATRPWLGTLYLVAVYCRALSGAEVAQNFVAGP